MLLAIVAITMASMWTLWDHYRLSWDRWRMGGQIWAEWVHTLDRVDIPATWTGGDWTAVRDGLYGGSTAELPAAGLGGDAGRDFGVSVAHVPMQFTAIEIPPSPDLPVSYCASPGLIGAPPEEQCQTVGAARLRPASRGRLDAIRRGIIDGGLGTVAIAGPAPVGTPPRWLRGSRAITEHESALETGFGGPFEYGDLVAIAHVSIVRRERALHRRAPPGRPGLAGMLTTLDMGGQDMTVEGAPPWGVAPEDSLDVEVDNIEGVGQARVAYTPVSDGEPAVRADFFVSASLTLRATPSAPREAHAVGIRVSGLPDALNLDEVLVLEANATVADAETECARQDAGERCVAAETLSGGILESRGPLQVQTNQAGQTTESGVVSRTMNADTLNLNGECHGCQSF